MLVPMNNEILRFLRILFNIVLLIKFLPTGSFMTEPRVRPRGAAALPTLVRKAPPQSMTGLGDECYRLPPKSETSAYVVARIVPVASDYEDSLVRVARATRLI